MDETQRSSRPMLPDNPFRTAFLVISSVALSVGMIVLLFSAVGDSPGATGVYIPSISA